MCALSGSYNIIDNGGVQYILDSMIEMLLANSTRKFSQTEQAFFQRWYAEQTPATQKAVQGLVASGQLEFINGGWCMHDEATALYIDMIDQTALGHAFIASEFGVYPTVGWQIDPFGHSSTQASLLSYEMGFDSLYFARIDFQDKAQRLADKATEMIWRASPSAGASNQLFTAVFFDGYGAPDGFCYDMVRCTDDPVMPDPNIEGYNIPAQVNSYVSAVLDHAAAMQTGATEQGGGEVMILAGDDFNWGNAQQYYKNLDALMDAVNADGRLHMFYSTPSEFTLARNAAQQTAAIEYPLKNHTDFFPYASDAHGYWSGYYTSRPALKKMVRDYSGWFMSARMLTSLAGRGTDAASSPGVDQMRKAVAVAQHHDAVSGTSMQHVACDYALRLDAGWTAAQPEMFESLGSLLTVPGGGVAPPLDFSVCRLSNISVCEVTQSSSAETTGSIVVVLVNPWAHPRREMVELPLPAAASVGGPCASAAGWTILDSTLSAMPVQYIAQLPSSAPGRLDNSSECHVAWMAEVEPLGAATFFLEVAAAAASEPVLLEEESDSPNDIVLSNEYLSLTFSASTGLLSSLSILQALDGSELGSSSPTQSTVELSQGFFFYTPFQDPRGLKKVNQSSGAYIFRPNASIPMQAVQGESTVTISNVITTGLSVQLTQTFSDWCVQTVRLVSGEPFARFEWNIGPLPIDSGYGMEVVSRFSSSLASSGWFATDSNGREMQPRQRFARPYPFNLTEPVAGEYYPVTTVVSLSDSAHEMALVVDRAQGCSSLQDGALECMLHRRLLTDDARGVREPLNETAFMTPYELNKPAMREGPGLAVTGSSMLVITPGGPGSASAIHRPLASRTHARLLPLLQPLAPVGLTPQIWVDKFLTNFSAMAPQSAGGLPAGLEVITMESLSPSAAASVLGSASSAAVEGSAPNSILLRVANSFGVAENATTLSFSLGALFVNLPAGVAISTVTELSLPGTRALSAVPPRLVWNTPEQDEASSALARKAAQRRAKAQAREVQRAASRPDSSMISVSPMQVRTLLVSFQSGAVAKEMNGVKQLQGRIALE